MQIQDTGSSDEESAAVPPTKTAMVSKLAQIQHDICMNISINLRNVYLMKENVNNRRMKKMKKSLALSKSTAVSNDKETSNDNMPNQYARVKYSERGGGGSNKT
jgi:uncharacterized protein (UPF0147 family)